MPPDLTALSRRPFDGHAIDRLIETLSSAAPAGSGIARPLVARPLIAGPSDKAAPLLVIVHPASLCGSYETSLLALGEPDVREDIARLAATWRGDIAVLHGELSDELDARINPGRRAIGKMVDRAWADQTSLLAPAMPEDLEAAACWLITDMAADQRPYITVTGAWADEEDGCVTTVATYLRRYCLNVIVPEFTPSLSPKPKRHPAAQLHASWRAALQDELEAPYMDELRSFLKTELAAGKIIYPEPKRYFAALNATPLDRCRVVILGQDPYHGPGQAHGLAFSVPRGVTAPPSLRNIFKELYGDLGMAQPVNGCLDSWAAQGVLLLNTVLSVEAGAAASHAGKGWEGFTDAIIRTIDDRRSGVVFLLWGAHAQKKGADIDRRKHLVLEAPHPSPLSAYRGFFGSKPFSRINAYFSGRGEPEIDWRLD